MDIIYYLNCSNNINNKYIKYIHKYEKKMKEYNIDKYYLYYVCVAINKNSNKFIGIGKAGIYSSNTVSRCSQWDFIENSYRNLWIDLLYVKSKYRGNGIGRIILKNLEECLYEYYKNSSNILRANIYVFASIGNEDFYNYCGYKQINTKNDSDPYKPLRFMKLVGKWYAKGINNTIDNEDIININ